MEKYLCIHGHFYQPPRENAWLEEIEVQPSAHPYHDWNERITEECYASNNHSRILNDEQKIVDIVNNYAKISFNFGPTLLSWLEQHAPVTYQGILDADKLSQQYFNGHGSAVAQVYNHLIMPLANRNDKETQIKWGLYDFKQRFGRDAKGIWLAETAVDLETLEILVDNKIEYTILAPNQAHRFRKIGEKDWTEGIDSNRHYTCNLPNGKSITLFFYDGDRSQGVAFKGLLANGHDFAQHLLSGFRDGEKNQLVHIATDGESYGHHHKNGDMALAYCLRYIETNNLARITNYAEYNSLFKPEYEVEIHEDSSWSCAHGVERWRSNCGCHTGGMPGWSQEWRKPLRDALDGLRDKLIEIYVKETKGVFKDPWKARNDYIEVMFNRSKVTIERFLHDNCAIKLKERDKTKMIRLLEMQRHAQLMYTSCGWFFNEVSGIETIQILQYACRAIQLAESESEYVLESDFLKELAKAKSNIEDVGNGADIYRKSIEPFKLSLTQVGMHYAVASLFANNPESLTVLNYDCQSVHFNRMIAGVQRLAVGTTHVHSKVTLSQKEFSFVVLYLGQHHLMGATTQTLSSEEFESITDQLQEEFKASNIVKVIDLIKENFAIHRFSFFQMFKDEQLKMLKQVLTQSQEQAYDSYRKVYDVNYNLLTVMNHQNLHIPTIMKKNIELVVNTELVDVIAHEEEFNLEKFTNLIEEVVKWDVQLDQSILKKQLKIRMDQLIGAFKQSPSNLFHLENLLAILRMVKRINLEPNLISIQNEIFQLSRSLLNNKLKLDNQTLIVDLLDCIGDEINLDTRHLEAEVEV